MSLVEEDDDDELPCGVVDGCVLPGAVPCGEEDPGVVYSASHWAKSIREPWYSECRSGKWSPVASHSAMWSLGSSYSACRLAMLSPEWSHRATSHLGGWIPALRG